MHSWLIDSIHVDFLGLTFLFVFFSVVGFGPRGPSTGLKLVFLQLPKFIYVRNTGKNIFKYSMLFAKLSICEGVECLLRKQILFLNPA
ncbi:unnamed protein product [Camellia sinensis]